MKFISHLMLAAALTLGTAPIVMSVPASAGAHCDKGGYLGKDGLCHTPGKPVGPAVVGSKEQAFRDDCIANGGTVYTAAQWNPVHPEAPLVDGRLQCHKPGSWGPTVVHVND